MAIEATIADPSTVRDISAILPPGAAPVKPDQLIPPPSEEQRQAVDALFAQEKADDKETELVAGMIGMWTGTLLLHDLAVEHLRTSPEEEDEAKKLPRAKFTPPGEEE